MQKTASVDVKTRKQVAELLRHLVAGLISNDEFEDRLPRLNDVASRRVFWEGAWALYDDLHEHGLIGKRRLDRGARDEVARWIMFLETDLPYEWPVLPVWLRILLVPLHLLTFGGTSHLVRRYVSRGGDPDVWPFRRRDDYERVLRQPPYFHG